MFFLISNWPPSNIIMVPKIHHPDIVANENGKFGFCTATCTMFQFLKLSIWKCDYRHLNEDKSNRNGIILV